MFDEIDLDVRMDKAAFKRVEEALRYDLIKAQYELRESGQNAVHLVMIGFDVLQRARTARRLMHWFDPRYIRRFGRLSGEKDRESHLEMWTHWQSQPRKGMIGLFVHSWYDELLRAVAKDKLSKKEIRAACARIRNYEQLLVDDGDLVLKVAFLQSGKSALHSIEELEKDEDIPWKVTDTDRKLLKAIRKDFKGARRSVYKVLEATDTSQAPWHGIAAADQHHCDHTLGRLLVSAITDVVTSSGQSDEKPVIPEVSDQRPDHQVVETPIDPDDASARLEAAQRRLTQLSLSKAFEDHSLVVVFEGHDAAGKGGTIRRMAEALDMRMSRVVRIGAPSAEEKAHHYLWRFWRNLPTRGRIVTFDRSWYGRVLVERVEGYATDAEWQRAYQEIRQFEQEMRAEKVIVIKFWLSITQDEQLRRFRDRENTPYKRHKITDEDWRNREKWPEYEIAIKDMLLRTHDEDCPWYVVDSNDKPSARVNVIETLNTHLEACLKR